jgi:hypothetical protein
LYTGQTGRSIEMRIKEHRWHIHLSHLGKSTDAEHSINLDHRIQLHSTSILAKKSRRLDWIMREARDSIPATSMGTITYL